MEPTIPGCAKLETTAADAWLASNPLWVREDDSLARRFKFPDFSSALAFAVRVGLLGEKRDHHPTMKVMWGKTKVLWTTVDAGGITQLDLDLAEETNQLAAGL